MTKAVRFNELGGPEVLKVEDVNVGDPGEGEVAIKVHAVGLNRAESMYFHGRYMEQPQLPSKLGYEAAGTVTKVGTGVSPELIGKQFATIPGFSQNRDGVLGEEAIVPVHVLAELPSSMSPVDAAAVEGTLYIYGVLSGQPTNYPMTGFAKGVALTGYTMLQMATPERREKLKRYIYDGLVKGTLKPKIDRVFSFDQVQEAYRYLESNAQVGKIVIKL